MNPANKNIAACCCKREVLQSQGAAETSVSTTVQTPSGWAFPCQEFLSTSITTSIAEADRSNSAYAAAQASAFDNKQPRGFWFLPTVTLAAISSAPQPLQNSIKPFISAIQQAWEPVPTAVSAGSGQHQLQHTRPLHPGIAWHGCCRGARAACCMRCRCSGCSQTPNTSCEATTCMCTVMHRCMHHRRQPMDAHDHVLLHVCSCMCAAACALAQALAHLHEVYCM